MSTPGCCNRVLALIALLLGTFRRFRNASEGTPLCVGRVVLVLSTLASSSQTMAYSFGADTNTTPLNATDSRNSTEDSKDPQNRHKKFGDIGIEGIIGGAIAGVVVPALVILLGTVYWQCFKDRDDGNIEVNGNSELELLPSANNKQLFRKLPHSENGEYLDNVAVHDEGHSEMDNSSNYNDGDEILSSPIDSNVPSAADGLIMRCKRKESSSS
mmetsp:Transcript_7407/g.12137  ORF Transcript_7407/g.12137 Transcript_7407/m.12137 type:complete len:214 (-) Transcript_7407:22-663(-)